MHLSEQSGIVNMTGQLGATAEYKANLRDMEITHAHTRTRTHTHTRKYLRVAEDRFQDRISC